MTKLSNETLQEVIDTLRAFGGGVSGSQYDDLANMLQFGVEGRDESDGRRCNFCDLPVSGESSHKCW